MKTNALLLCLFIAFVFASAAGCGSRDGRDVAATPAEIEAYLKHNPSPIEVPYEVE